MKSKIENNKKITDTQLTSNPNFFCITLIAVSLLLIIFTINITLGMILMTLLLVFSYLILERPKNRKRRN
jgi:accessory gene regulator protein AgrB